MKPKATTHTTAPAQWSRGELENAVQSLALAEIEAEAIRASIDLEVEATQRKFADQARLIEERRLALLASVAAWAVAHREREFGQRQTLTILGHDLKFLAGKPSVGLADGVTEGTVVARLLQQRPWWRRLLFSWLQGTGDYLKVAFTLKKSVVLDRWANHQAEIEGLGLTVGREESFKFSRDKTAEPKAVAAALRSSHKAAIEASILQGKGGAAS